MQIQPLATLPQLRGLLEVSRLVRDERDLTRLADAIAATISGSLGFRTVAINLYRPAEDDFELTTIHGGGGAREALLGTTNSPDAWAPCFADRFLRRGAYLIPHGEGGWEGLTFQVPDLEVSPDPDAWHPEDALIVPMRGADGTLLGVVSVDEPESGLRPTDEELDVLVAFVEHVIGAIEAAQDAAAAARDRASLAQLLDVSASLVELDSADDVLQAVARGIGHALEFEKVAVCLARDGRFSPAGTAGWEPDDPGLDWGLTDADLDLLLVPEFEIEGCYLIEDAAAIALVGDGSYQSRRGGAGPRAWSNHWLLVPLIERNGSRSGFVWADDPSDSMLPSRQRLQALRTFANQATMALRAAIDLETLTRRNGELAALHRTTLGLLDRLDLDRVLETIVDSARSLLDTPHGFLYLVDDDLGALQLSVRLGLFEHLSDVQVRRGEGISGRVWESGQSLAVDNYRSWSGGLAAYRGLNLAAVLGVPLRAGNEIRGVLGLAYDEPGRSFGPAEIELLERFAQLAALALDNARLYDDVRRSEELHRRVLENSRDMIALVNLNGRITYANAAHERVLGYSVDELVGMSAQELADPDDPPLALNGEPPPLATRRIRRKDGSWAELEGSTVMLHNPAGEPEVVLLFARDVSDRERLAEQLRQAQKMESIGRLAGGIAHDFNNLLTAIGGYAELSLLELDAGESEPARESINQIARASRRAAELTSQLLAFSRKQVLQPRALDLNEVVADMTSMLSRMLGEDIVLSTAFEPRLGTTLADPTQLEQVVLNLAINARDAMPGGGRLSIRTTNIEVGPDDVPPHADVAAGSYVGLSVCDTGIGMEADVAQQIFEPFFTTKNVGEGTGLGLATVHGIVSQSGGAIWVESSSREGTCFTVCLPRVEAPGGTEAGVVARRV